MLFIILSYACVFFFKQKTAYEMRISDWSSDVCSSDLVVALKLIHQEVLIIIQVEKSPDRPSNGGHRLNLKGLIRNCLLTFKDRLDSLNHILRCGRNLLIDRTSRADLCSLCRSEEHTSELQSLMRISYYVFSLKKIKTSVTHIIT